MSPARKRRGCAQLVRVQEAHAAGTGFAECDAIGICIRDAWLEYAAARKSDEGPSDRSRLVIWHNKVQPETDVFLSAALRSRIHQHSRRPLAGESITDFLLLASCRAKKLPASRSAPGDGPAQVSLTRRAMLQELLEEAPIETYSPP